MIFLPSRQLLTPPVVISTLEIIIGFLFPLLYLKKKAFVTQKTCCTCFVPVLARTILLILARQEEVEEKFWIIF